MDKKIEFSDEDASLMFKDIEKMSVSVMKTG